MSTKNHPTAHVDITLAGASLVHQIDEQKAIRAAAAKSPHFADDPTIKQCLDRWSGHADELAANVALVADLEKQLGVARSKTPPLVQAFHLDAKAFASTIDSTMQGDAEAIASFGVPTATRTLHTYDNVAPTNVRIAHTKAPGSYTIRWKPTPGAGAYEMQIGSEAADEASFATVYTGKHASADGAGKIGQRIAVRVRTLGIGTTPSAWSQPVTVIIR